ncbi:hypothetical protein GF367_04425 [Candidatus Woesearchaeota archaeon]|nr:hypothetical protein [Candidatus Woesearchaeota archaeon]
MDKKEVMTKLLDEQLLKLLKIFINNPAQEYYLRELAKRARVPPATTYRTIQLFKKLDLIKEHKMKRFKFYSLHEENAAFLADILADRKSAVQEFVDTVKQDPNIEMMVLHGKEERSKANILIIGNNIDQELIRDAALQAKEAYGFNIIHLTLVPDQYNQMSSMGLYPGKKVILYEK